MAWEIRRFAATLMVRRFGDCRVTVADLPMRSAPAANGSKVYMTTEEETFENPDGTFTTFTRQWKNHVHYQDMGQGQHRKVLLVRYPVRAKNVEEWSRRVRLRAAATEYQRSKMHAAAGTNDEDVMFAGYPQRE